MAQNTFRQTVMSNAPLMSNAPQKTWQQPPELSPAAQLYTPGAAPTPTQAPPAMAAPAAPTPAQSAGFYGTRVEDAFGSPFQNTPNSISDPMASTGDVMPSGLGQVKKDVSQWFNDWAAQSIRNSSQTLEQMQAAAGWTPKAIDPTLASAPSSMTTPAPAPEPAPEPAPDLAIKPQSAVQLDPTSDEAILARRAQRQGTSSPQQNFQLRVSNGEPLSQEEITQAESLAKHMGTTFDPETGYSRQPFLDAQSTPQQGVQQGSGLTTVGGAPLNEFLSGAAMPERGFARAENAMYGDNSLSRGLGGDAATKAFQDASDARVARMEQNFGQARGPDSKDRGSGMSMEEATRLAGGDTALAKRMIELEKQGYDPVTEQPVQSGDGLTETERLNKLKFEYQKAQDALEWGQAANETRTERVDEMNTEIGALGTIIDQTANVSGTTEAAQRKVGANTAGFFHPLKWIGGTEAASLAGNLETIKSDAFVSNITEMRQNSPTGGAVGNVSDKDLEMLQSLQTSFRQDLPPSELKRNLADYRKIRNKVANDAKKGFIRKYGQENFDKHFGDNATGNQGQTQTKTTPSASRTSDDDLVDKWNK